MWHDELQQATKKTNPPQIGNPAGGTNFKADDIMKNTLLSASFLALLFISFGASAMFSSVHVFGDSLSDSGNAFIGQGFVSEPFPYTASVPSNSYAPYNVFSNGPVWVQYVAADLGLSLDPSFIGGTNYALGGEATGELMFGATTVGAGPLGGILGQANFASAGDRHVAVRWPVHHQRRRQ